MVEKVAAISEVASATSEVTGVSVDAPADPWALARRIEALGDVVVLATAADANGSTTKRARWSYVAAGALGRSTAWVPEDEVSRARDEGEETPWAHIPRWVGLVPYEHARALERAAYAGEERRPPPHHLSPSWRRYDAILAVNHASGQVFAVGDDAKRVRELARLAQAPGIEPGSVGATLLDDDASDHEARISQALRLIAQGDLYQVNLARRVSLAMSGDPLAAFERFASHFPASYGAALLFDGEPAVVSTSPELFLRASPDGSVLTSPIKGTRPRGRDAEEDARLRRELDDDAKERAELTMVVDLERNDLGRVARLGTVRVRGEPRVVTHRTLHHRVADVAARLRDGVTREELLRAMFPSGSVTGAPKVRAMEVIARLEAHRRGLYTGALGFVARDGSLVLSIAIRTLTLADGEARYFTGGGIVEASDPRREVEETRTKALHLVRAFLG